MKIFAYPKTEPNKTAYAWKLMLGPASLLDGIVETVTLGRYGIGARYTVARNLARSRMVR